MFLNHYTRQMLACDCFTVDTVFNRTLSALFFLELGTCRVDVAGCTAHPMVAGMTQQARQMSWCIQKEALPVCFLVRDDDATFPPGITSWCGKAE